MTIKPYYKPGALRPVYGARVGNVVFLSTSRHAAMVRAARHNLTNPKEENVT